jgi:regulator of protease activity HflC (stomatin/prohibitin superfamily)
MPTLDQLLRFISILAWLFFAIFAIVLFVRTVVRHGIVAAILQMLSVRVLLPLLAVIAITFISASIVFVPPTNVAVVVSLISPGGVRPQPMRSGLHLIVPVLERDVQYPIYWQTYTMSNKIGEGVREGDDSIRARTSDGQEVRLDSSVIFRIDQVQAVTIHVDWQERYIEEFVRPVIRGYVRTQVSQFTAREVNSAARRDLETNLDRRLREEFAGKGLIMDQFLLRDITFTDEYADSVEEKQVAQEGVERAQNEANQVRNLAEGERDRLRTVAEGRRDQLILEAEGRARSILLEAEAQAEALGLIAEALSQNRDLLTYEYINKLSPNIRAMLVPNDAPLILPLQDLVNELDMTEPLTATETITEPALSPNLTPPPTPTAPASPTPNSANSGMQ